DWLEVMETAHGLGLRTTATMMFGHVETLEERIDHLLHLRGLQDRTRGFTAFIAWTFQPENTAMARDELTSFQYLRTLAVARLMLDNFPSVQASWVTQGGKIGQLSLRFGANDFGSLMIEENVVSAAGAHFRLTEAEIARGIQDAGFIPKRRTMHYEIVGDPYCWSHDVPTLPAAASAATSSATAAGSAPARTCTEISISAGLRPTSAQWRCSTPILWRSTSGVPPVRFH
ncbi:MAG TPA: hypothetical protein VLV15_13490, partial [Dongiaceae bacterium]|nr:hypothetical protein [Dongiaceae bacterium]